jgi:hypothetical protein
VSLWEDARLAKGIRTEIDKAYAVQGLSAKEMLVLFSDDPKTGSTVFLENYGVPAIGGGSIKDLLRRADAKTQVEFYKHLPELGDKDAHYLLARLPLEEREHQRMFAEAAGRWHGSKYADGAKDADLANRLIWYRVLAERGGFGFERVSNDLQSRYIDKNTSEAERLALIEMASSPYAEHVGRYNEVLFSAITDKSVAIQTAGIRGLANHRISANGGYFPRHQAIKKLIELHADPKFKGLEADLILAVGNFPDVEGVPFLLQRAKDARTKEPALKALASVGAKEGMERIFDEMVGGNDSERLWALQAVQRFSGIQDPKMIRLITQSVRFEKSDRNRAEATRALRRFATNQDAVKLLVTTLEKDPSPEVRLAAARGLVSCYTEKHLVEPLVPKLKELADQIPDPKTKKEYLEDLDWMERSIEFDKRNKGK